MRKNLFDLGKIPVLVLALFLQPAGLMAQQLPDSSLADFYPLNPGDYWEYHYLVGSTVQSLVTREVIGDSVMSNGKAYKVIEEFWQYNNERLLRFQRYDSSTVYEYLPEWQQEVVWYAFGKPVGEFWPTGRPGLCDTSQIGRIESIAESQIFGEPRSLVRISYYCARDTSLWLCDDLLQGIGVYYLGGEGDAQVLQGAIIAGKPHGVLTHIRGSESAYREEGISVSNYPNPFNAATVIKYGLPTPAQVAVNIYDLNGRLVTPLFQGAQPGGKHALIWDGRNASGETVATGVYIISVRGKNFQRSKPLVFLK